MLCANRSPSWHCPNEAAPGRTRCYKHLEMHNRNSLKQKYGTTHDELREKQLNTCALCGKSLGDWRRVCIDHDHKTGKIRGLVCKRCNIFLRAVDDESFLDKAKLYLKKGLL